MTNNWASSPTAYPFFILKVRLKGTHLRCWSTSVSSLLVSLVSGTRSWWYDTDGPCVGLSNTSSSSDKKITQGETQELRSHTEQFRTTNLSLTDPGAEFFAPLPQSDRETPADVLWTEWGKTKYLRRTDLKQGKMSQKQGANEE